MNDLNVPEAAQKVALELPSSSADPINIDVWVWAFRSDVRIQTLSTANLCNSLQSLA